MDSLLGLLQGTLDPNPNVRLQAELDLGHLCTQSATALALSQVATESSVELHLRQISSTGFALKKYVKEHWSPFFSTFKGPVATDPETKQQVRNIIFGGLSDPVRKMRLACAAVVSDIAHPDWPDDWPTLMSQLLHLIGPGASADSVDGGMRVLIDFVGIDLPEDQLLPIAREMLPHLMSILGSPQTHSPSTRARAILIFRQCVMTLFTVKDEHPVAVKTAVAEILPQWLDAFQQLLNFDIMQDLQGDSWEGLAIRKAIYEALEVVINSFPSTLKTLLPRFITMSMSHLSAIAPVYRAAFLSSSSDFDVPAPVEEDSQVASDLPGLVATMLDFLCQTVKRKSIKSLFVEAGKATALLDASIGIALTFAQMTADDEESWATDPNAFVADEDDEMATYNVRAASIDLVNSFVEAFEITAISSLWTAFQGKATEADAARSRGEEDCWKLYEAALAIVGAVSEDLLDHVQECSAEGKSPVFDLGNLFSSIVPNYLTASELPFLQGRSFVFASQFAQALPSDLANQYIDAAIQVLGAAEAGVPVKVSAVRALLNFFRHLKENVDASRASQSLARLLPLLPQTTENTLVLIIDAVQVTLKVAAPSLDRDTCSLLVRILLDTWMSKPEDPMLATSIGDVFSSMAAAAASSPAVLQSLVNDAFPELSASVLRVRIDPFGASVVTAVDVIDSIFNGLPTPLGEGAFAAVAPAIFEVLAVAEDREMVQSGLSIVTSVVRKDVNQLLNWRDESGRTGLELVLAAIAKILEPSQTEAGGLFVGDLVLHLIRKAGSSLGPVLPDLLRAFVTRLATAQTSSFAQSLILPFAYLVHQQLDTVLSLLESMTVPGQGSLPARSALEVLLTSWCEHADVFQGFWQIKVSSVAMSQLFQSPHPALQQITVRGDLLITAANANTIMTRSKARHNPDQFQPIPFPAKALKILLKDAQNAASENLGTGMGGAADADSDDGDDEWADEGEEFAGDKNLDFLSDLLGPGGSLAKWAGDDDSDGEGDNAFDEQDLKDDPIYNLDMQSHLFAFFRQAYESDISHFRALAEQYLNAEEKALLSHILSSA